MGIETRSEEHQKLHVQEEEVLGRKMNNRLKR
jgi:hypothetical protein